MLERTTTHRMVIGKAQILEVLRKDPGIQGKIGLVPH